MQFRPRRRSIDLHRPCNPPKSSLSVLLLSIVSALATATNSSPPLLLKYYCVTSYGFGNTDTRDSGRRTPVLIPSICFVTLSKHCHLYLCHRYRYCYYRYRLEHILRPLCNLLLQFRRRRFRISTSVRSPSTVCPGRPSWHCAPIDDNQSRDWLGPSCGTF